MKIYENKGPLEKILGAPCPWIRSGYRHRDGIDDTTDGGADKDRRQKTETDRNAGSVTDRDTGRRHRHGQRLGERISFHFSCGLKITFFQETSDNEKCEIIVR